jgi:hypothetical protein
VASIRSGVRSGQRSTVEEVLVTKADRNRMLLNRCKATLNRTQSV